MFTGGDIIIDYRVSIASAGGSFSILASGVIPTTFTATSLTAGVTYQFKVESRNSYGYSAYSSPITMLCAFIPEPPTTVSTTNSADQVVISWSAPVTNGSPITSYRIYIQQHGSTIFTQEFVECD